MNLNQARREAMRLIASGQAVMLQSGSGIGKSDLVYQMFLEIRERDAAKGIRWGYGTIFGANQTPPDLIGYQYKGEREFGDGNGGTRTVTVTDPSVPLWMISVPVGIPGTADYDPGGKPAWMYDRFWLFIDEYGQTEGDTKRGLAEVFLKGGTAPWYLPPGSVRIAATNQGVRYGVSKDFDFCIARRTLLEIEGDPDVWLAYADTPYLHQGRMWQTMPAIKAWAASNPGILFEPEPKEQRPWSNPRQVNAVDRYLQVTFEEQGNQEVDPISMSTIAGTIGMPATQSLCDSLQFRLELPSYQEVVADPTGAPVPTRVDLQMLMTYEMAGHTKVEDLGPCITYMQRVEKECKDMGVTYVSALLRRDYRNIINQPAMVAWINKNATMVNIVAALSNR